MFHNTSAKMNWCLDGVMLCLFADPKLVIDWVVALSNMPEQDCKILTTVWMVDSRLLGYYHHVDWHVVSNVSENHAAFITRVWTTKTKKFETRSRFEVASYSKTLHCVILTGFIQIPTVICVLFGVSLSWWRRPVCDWYITACNGADLWTLKLGY
jgi:hypothetical protein